MSLTRVGVAEQPPSPSKHILSPDASTLDDSSQHVLKRRRTTSMSSLSDADDKDDDEDEDRPLASRVRPPGINSVAHQDDGIPRSVGHGSGKKTSSMKTVAQTAPPSHQPTAYEGVPYTNGKINGVKGQILPSIKLEDHMDENQLSRLANGVTVDTGTSAPTPVSFSIVYSLCLFSQQSPCRPLASRKKWSI